MPTMVVSLPRATEFNQVLTLDLKFRPDEKPILYMIDMFSRLTLGDYVKDKRPENIAAKVIERWIGNGMGLPAMIHTDGGTEFRGIFHDVASILGVLLTATAGYAPYQNSLNERNHSTVDRTMVKYLRDNPKMDKRQCLWMACNAKNTLAMHNGFSSYQLVYGKNPQLPSNLNKPWYLILITQVQ